ESAKLCPDSSLILKNRFKKQFIQFLERVFQYNRFNSSSKSNEKNTNGRYIRKISAILVFARLRVEIVKNYKTEKRCLGEADKLNQVWINLLNNALQSMNYKGKIEIETREENPWIVVSWTDSGTGIPEPIQDKIFDPFFTTKKNGEGMGLGLDICKKIIDSFGGKIEFQTAPGRTKFSVWLRSEF
ncbi:sensor histidine kinase, partial [Leptospira santarosai]